MAYVVVNKRSSLGKTKNFTNNSYIPNESRIDRDGKLLLCFLKFPKILSTGSLYYESAAT